MSDKRDFKNCKKRQRSSLYNNNGLNSLRSYNNYKYALNIGAPKYIKQILTELRKINWNIIIVRNFNYPLSTMDRSSQQSFNKETGDLNTTD